MQNYFNINDIKLYVEIRGQGEPLLLIPGLGTGTWLWSKNIEVLSKHFELIMPELRGSGRSEKPDQRYSIALFAEDIKALIQKLQYRKVAILGVSMGGFIAQHYAANWPEHINSLILVGTSQGGNQQIGPTGEVLCRTIRPRGRSKRERLEDGYDLNFSKDFMSQHPEELEKITNRRTEFAQPEYAYYRQLLAGAAFDGQPCTPKIQAPTLICAAQNDPLVPIEDAYTLQKSIRGSQLEVFAGKHLFLYEHYEKFNRIIIDFLNETMDMEKAHSENLLSE